MEYLIMGLIYFCSFVVFGLTLEIVFTGLSKIPKLFNKKEDEEDKLLGHVPMWMIPVYGILLSLIYVPIFYLMFYFQVHFLIRFVIWAISITAFEALSGWFYDKGLFKLTKGKFSIKPWNYSTSKDSLFNGYTRWLFIPLWGIVGMLLEPYSFMIVNSVKVLTINFLSYFLYF